MATETSKLLLEIDASVELLRRNLTKAEQRVEQFGAKTDASLDKVDRRFARAGNGALGIGRNLDQVNAKVRGIGGGLAAATAGLVSVATVTAVAQLAARGLEYASSLGEVAQQLGVTTNTLQEYRYAATQTGITQDEIDAGLARLTRTAGEAANGAKKPAAAFRELGVSLKDSNGRIRDVGDLLPDIAKGLSTIPDAATRARLEVALFGKAGQSLAPLLETGAGGINNLREAAHSLGIVLSSRQIQDADEAADKLTQLKTVLEANIAGVVADNAKAIIDLADSLEYLVRASIKAAKAYSDFSNTYGVGRVVREVSNVGIRGSNIITGRSQPLLGQTDPNAALNRILNSPIEGVDFNRRGVPETDTGGGGGGGRSRGRSGPDPAEVARRRARAEAQYADDLGRTRVDELRSIADLTGSATARYNAEIAEIEERRASFNRQITLDEDLTAARRTELSQRQDVLDFNAKAIAEQDLSNSRVNDRTALLEDQIKREREALQGAVEFADSAKARLDIELRLVDLAQREERARLDRVLAAEKTSSVEYEIAARQLDELDAVRSRATNSARSRNETPAQAFLREIGRSSDAINEDLQQIQVDGLNSLNDGIVDVITGAKSLGDVFDDVAGQIISALLRIAIQQAIIEPLANSLFGGGSGGGGGGGIGGFLGGLFGGSSSSAKGTGLFSGLTKRATGGPVRAGVPYLTGEAGRELFIPTADGKIISNATLNSRRGGGGGAPSLALTINAPGATAETVAMIRRELQAAAPQIISAARDVTLRAASRPHLPGAR